MDGIGTTRRLQALAVRGFGVRWVSERTGLDAALVSSIRNGSKKEVSEDTCIRVRSVTDYSLTLPDPGDNETRFHATQYRWYPLGAWDNPDDALCVPEEPGFDPERDEAVGKLQRLHARGFSIKRLSSEMRINRSAVGRIIRSDTDAFKSRYYDRIVDTYDQLSQKGPSK